MHRRTRPDEAASEERREAAPAAAPVRGGGYSPADVLALQQTAGNHAVQGMLAGLAPGIPKPAGEEDEVAVDEFVGGTLARNGDGGTTAAPANADAGAPAAPAAVTIGTTTNSGPTWANHGSFDWRVGFTTSGRSGWIVQEIANTYAGEKTDGTALPWTGTPLYWEAWAVSSGGAVTPAIGSDNDYWIRPGRGTGTKGRWTMRGRVYFTTTDPATQGFAARGVRDAGILLASTSAPAGLGDVRLTRNASGTWDSTGATPTHTGAAA